MDMFLLVVSILQVRLCHFLGYTTLTSCRHRTSGLYCLIKSVRLPFLHCGHYYVPRHKSPFNYFIIRLFFYLTVVFRHPLQLLLFLLLLLLFFFLLLHLLTLSTFLTFLTFFVASVFMAPTSQS